MDPAQTQRIHELFKLGLDLNNVERIEIVRGPGSALYGTGAMFGVINIITKRGNNIDGLNVAAQLGSYGRVGGSALFGKEADNGLDVFVSGLWTDVQGQDLYFEEYDDPATNNGIARDLDHDRYYGLLTTVEYDAWTLQSVLTSRKKSIPTGAFEIAFNDPRAYTLDQRLFLELQHDTDIGSNKHVKLRGYFNHHYYEGDFPYDLEDYMVNYFEMADGIWAGGEFQLRFDPRPSNRLIAGAEYTNHVRADFEAREDGDLVFGGDFPFHVYSFYLQDEYQVRQDLSLTLGIRRDEYSTAGSATNPRGAIVYNAFKFSTLKLLYGEAFRAPNINEVHIALPEETKGNLNLKPERIRTVEVVWEQRLSDELFGTVSLYDYRMKDLIDTIEDQSDELFQHRNVSKVEAKGIEVELHARTGSELQGYASYVLQDAKDPVSKQKLTNSPTHIAKAGASYPLSRHFNAAAEVLYESARSTVFVKNFGVLGPSAGEQAQRQLTADKIKTDHYFLTNLKLTAQPRLRADTPWGETFEHLHISVQVRNLFDVTYSTPGGHEHQQPAIIQNGRNFAFRMEYQF